MRLWLAVEPDDPPVSAEVLDEGMEVPAPVEVPVDAAPVAADPDVAPVDDAELPAVPLGPAEPELLAPELPLVEAVAAGAVSVNPFARVAV